jgi:hypothetical protein
MEARMLKMFHKSRLWRPALLLLVAGGFCGGCFYEGGHDHWHHHDREWHDRW